MLFEHLIGRCHFCKEPKGPYNASATSKERHCCTDGLSADTTFKGHIELYPAIYPEPKDGADVAPPSPRCRPVLDGLAVMDADGGELSGPGPAFPYPNVPLEMQNLKCGNASIYNLGDLARKFLFTANNISVCDFSTYPWSSTLKDPRSWAVLCLAIKYGIKHLGVWTAGNAGYSVARLAYFANRFLPAERRIRVHCYYDRSEELPESIRLTLKSFDARVVGLRTKGPGRIFPPEAALERLNSGAEVTIRPDEYWDVTDGWDGVGLWMYRLLARQVCTALRPSYIVVPLGTGDLFFGFFLGRRDAIEASGIKNNECRIVAAIPTRNSILENYAAYGISIPPTITKEDSTTDSVAPKLETIYTPLLLVMYEAATRQQ